MLAWARELASEGDTGMGYPKEYGGKGSPGRSVTSFETLAMGDLSLLVKCGVQFGLFGGAILHLGTERHHEAYLQRRRADRPPGLLRDDRDRPRLQRAGAGDDRDLRGRRVRHPHARRRRAQGLHRQRRARRAHGRRLRAVDRGRRAARRARDPRADPRRGRRAAATACGSRTAAPSSASTASTTAASGSTTCASRARTCSTATRRSTRTAPTSARSRTRRKRFFTMIGTLIQGRISVSGASISATKVALTIAIRRALERRQFGVPGEQEALLMDYRTHQRRLLPPLAKTYALSFAQLRLVDDLHDGVHERARERARAARAGDARRGREGDRHLARDRDDPELPRGVRRRRLPALEPLRLAEGRHRRVHDLRGRQHDPAAARGQEPADRLQGLLRRARPARDGAVRRRAGARRADRAHRAAQARRLAGPRPRRRRQPARPQDAARRCSAGATSTCWRARRGG